MTTVIYIYIYIYIYGFRQQYTYVYLRMLLVKRYYEFTRGFRHKHTRYRYGIASMIRTNPLSNAALTADSAYGL